MLRYDGREWRFEGPGELTLGRGGGCDVVVADRKASRQHARIERRRDKVRARRSQLQRHVGVPYRGDRRHRAPARGTHTARERRDLFRSRARRGGRRAGGVLVRVKE